MISETYAVQGSERYLPASISLAACRQGDSGAGLQTSSEQAEQVELTGSMLAHPDL